MIGAIIYLVVLILVLAGMWRMYEKAGQPGWGAIVPIYNLYLLTVIAQKPGWWTVMFFIPLANIVFGVMTMYEVAKRFGKGVGFTVGLILLSFVFVPILGLGDAQYTPEATENN